MLIGHILWMGFSHLELHSQFVPKGDSVGPSFSLYEREQEQKRDSERDVSSYLRSDITSKVKCKVRGYRLW